MNKGAGKEEMNKKVKVFIFAEIIYGLIGNYILLIVYFILTSLKSGRLHKLSPDILNPFFRYTLPLYMNRKEKSCKRD